MPGVLKLKNYFDLLLENQRNFIPTWEENKNENWFPRRLARNFLKVKRKGARKLKWNK